MQDPLTPAGIEPATFRFVAQRLNHFATAVPTAYFVQVINLTVAIFRDTRGNWQHVVSTAVVSVRRQATGCTTGDMIPACGIDSLLGEKRTW